MKRVLALLILVPIVIALIVSPTMRGGIGVTGMLVCDPPPMVLDGVFCASLEIWSIVAAILIGTLLTALIVFVPFVIRWLRRQGGRET